MGTKIEIDNFSIDCVIFGYDQDELKALFIKRSTSPDFGKMALPGGFVFLDEDLDEAPMRRLREMTGLQDIYMKQVGTFGKINRYPLRRVITVVYYALVRVDENTIGVGLDASEASWIPITKVPELAFDHKELFDAALQKLQQEVHYNPILFKLLPEEFSISDAQSLYEAVLGKTFDKRNFRRRLKSATSLFLVDTGLKRVGYRHRAAQLYRFDQEAYDKMIADGMIFSL